MVARRVISSVIQRQVRYVHPVPARAAKGLVADVYAQVADEMRVVVPPVLAHSPAPEALAAHWMLVRETLTIAGRVDRARKEAVATAVSVANTCPYCVDMHSIGMYDLASEGDAEAIVADRVADVADPRIREIAAWARVMHRPDDPAARRPPFPPEDRPELVGVAVAFHYLNRVVNVFLPRFLVPRQIGSASGRRLKQRLSRVLRPMLRNPGRHGRSLSLLHDAPLPAAAGWAVGDAAIAAATARSYAAFEAAGARALPPAVRDLVSWRLGIWRGEDMGIQRDWCERLVAELPEADHAAGRLALLTAFASHRVDDEIVRAFRTRQPGDTALVEAVAWASFAAARQVGSWHCAETDTLRT